MSHHIDIVRTYGDQPRVELFPTTPRVGDRIELGNGDDVIVIDVTWRTRPRVHKPAELEWRPLVFVRTEQ